VIVTNFQSEFEITAQARGTNFGNPFLAGIALIALKSSPKISRRLRAEGLGLLEFEEVF
jgi:hypothetical protein